MTLILAARREAAVFGLQRRPLRLLPSGALPLSVQLANAISNDGHALFPVIALAPRTAVIATLYTSVPALITG